MANKKEFTKGLIKENPAFVLLLGLCPILGVTTMVSNAIGMGLSVLFVLTLSNIFISMLRNVIPDDVRIPSYIVIISSFVTIIEMLLHAYVPSLYTALGVYLPLIVVNCVILGRAEAFANKNTVADSALDGLGMGLGFTMALLLISSIREILGSGTISLFSIGGWDGIIHIPFIEANPIRVMTLAPGALLVMGCIIATINHGNIKKAENARKENK